MICYQDEKLYAPPAEDVSPEELEQRIRELEIKIYGHPISGEVMPDGSPNGFDGKSGYFVKV